MPPQRKSFDPDRIWALARTFGEPTSRVVMKFAHWLWKTGTTDEDSILAIIHDAMVRRPDNPYQYYAPGGVARDIRSAQASARIQEQRHEEFKRLERQFLEDRT